MFANLSIVSEIILYLNKLARGLLNADVVHGAFPVAKVQCRHKCFCTVPIKIVAKFSMPNEPLQESNFPEDISVNIVTLVKDTSIAFTVSYQEMFTIGKQIANSQTSFMPFLVAGVFYYIFNAIVGFVMGRVEKSMSYYQQ